MRTPRLVADDLVLGASGMGDADDWSDMQDDECTRWFGWPCRPGVERCWVHLEQVASDAGPGSFARAIRIPAGFAGGVGLKLHEGHWNISCSVHPAHQGRGIATHVLRFVCAWAFGDFDLNVTSTRARAGNAASLRVLAKVKFRPAREEIGGDGHVEVLHELAGGTHRT